MPDSALLYANIVSMGLHLAFGLLALALGALAIKWIDHVILRKIDLEAEIGRGNLAAGIYAAGLWIALALILSRAG